MSAPERLLALHRPLAFRRQVLQEVAPVDAYRFPQLPDGLIRCLGLQAVGLGEVLFEGLNVVGVVQRAPEGVAPLLEDEPFLATKRPPQAEHGVVEAAPELGCRGFGPEGHTYLLFGPALGM